MSHVSYLHICVRRHLRVCIVVVGKPFRISSFLKPLNHINAKMTGVFHRWHSTTSFLLPLNTQDGHQT
jgi:hypothetical protein